MNEIGGNRLKFGIEYEITKVKYRFYDGNRGKIVWEYEMTKVKYKNKKKEESVAPLHFKKEGRGFPPIILDSR